jgi:SpoVK/Ycf46/Vps4 family AAA+-type ATPase
MGVFALEEVIELATSEQLKSLIKAHVDCEDEIFKTVALQIVAHEAKLGHTALAREIKTLLDKFSINNKILITSQNPMLELRKSDIRLNELIVSDAVHKRIYRILEEFFNSKKLHDYGLKNRRKILLEGAPGTGKSMTAFVIAHELHLPLFVVQMDRLVTKFLGETSAKLREVFDSINSLTAVYLFDEFDSLGSNRGMDNEVGEIRRVLNSFLQFLEQDRSNSIIIAATNNKRVLDQALFRRFDDVLHYSLPSANEAEKLLAMKLVFFAKDFVASKALIERAMKLSHAEIVNVCDDAIKRLILEEREITEEELAALIDERLSIYSAQ